MGLTHRFVGCAGRAESADRSLARRQLVDAIAAPHGVGTVAEIDKDHADLATVVGIDRTRTVEDGNADLESEAGAGPYLCLELCREGNGDAGADHGAGARCQHEIRGHRAPAPWSAPASPLPSRRSSRRR